MKINKNSLQARVNTLAKEKNIEANIIYSRYFLIHFC